MSDTSETNSDIAIVGMAGRFPGAKSVDAFWRNLCDGVESISFLSDEDLRAAGVDKKAAAAPDFVPAGSYIDDIDQFDASFFGVSPREAELMDPQHRLFLECSWDALENAGYSSDKYKGWIGVYGGVGMNTYAYVHALPHASRKELMALELTDKDYLTTRVSYKLNLRGPSVAVQTACSTSLVAVHMACQGLLGFQCDMALAGGAQAHLARVGYSRDTSGLLSQDGHVRPFDADAQGTLFGSACGIVALKRLPDAVADGDTIWAVIKGSAINNDGSEKIGYSAPGKKGQAEVIALAQATAGVEPDSISYIEAHGTGTKLGDPLEIQALTEAFRARTQAKGFCAIGSLKGNIGHTGVAAGVSGLIKAALCLKRGIIPPSINYRAPNREMNLAESPFFVNQELRSWESQGALRRAGVSSFGMGGTNAHAILEEYPNPDYVAAERGDEPWQALVLSAKSPDALDAAAAYLADYLKRDESASLADVAYTLQRGRSEFKWRKVAVARDRADALRVLAGEDPSRLATSEEEFKGRSPIVFMFPGQGSQYAGMARGLYETRPVFRMELDRCFAALKGRSRLDLRSVLFPDDIEDAQARDRINDTAFAQPALFSVEYALAKLWMSWGIHPDAMIGHSIGEYVAACLAGVFTLEDALAVVAARGRLMSDLPPGSMLAVSLSEDELRAHAEAGISVAALNAPDSSVVSGPSPAIERLSQRLASDGAQSRPLRTSHAFHSSMMEPALGKFEAVVRSVPRRAPQLRFLSNRTGTWIRDSEAMDPAYWSAHLRGTVRFSDGIGELLRETPDATFLEVGPGNTLRGFASKPRAGLPRPRALASLGHPKESDPDSCFLLKALGRLWISGAPVDWEAFQDGQKRSRVPLPTYPFQRKRYWLDAIGSRRAAAKGPDLGVKPLDEWFYIPSFRRDLAPAPFAPGDFADQPRQWLVFADDCGLAGPLVEALRAEGHRATTVARATAYSRIGDDAYEIDPGSRADFERLVETLDVDAVLHLWNVAGDADAREEGDEYARWRDRSFFSLLSLAQVLGARPKRVDWYVCANRMQALGGEAPLFPERAMSLGPCRIIPSEYAQFRCLCIDFSWTADRDEPIGAWTNRLLAELRSEPADRLVALRGDERYVERYESVSLRPAVKTPPPLRESGVYAIAGGLGAIGLEIAGYLARTVRAKLALVGRTPLPPKEEWDSWIARRGADDKTSYRIRKIRELEAIGVEVLAVAADLTDEAQVEAAFGEIRNRFGAIHGVIHAAGIAGGGMIALKTREAADAVLAQKVKSMRAIERALAGDALDFLALCSSTLAIVPRIGQVDYCAANAFFDAYAPYFKAARGALAVSINWDAWSEIGMAVDAARVSAEPARPVSVAPDRADATFEPSRHEPFASKVAGESAYRARLSADKDWLLTEHRIRGVGAVPGTAILEMARAALADVSGRSAIELSDVFFLAPILVADGEHCEVDTLLEPEGNGFRFKTRSRSGARAALESQPWTENAFGACRAVSGGAPPAVDLAEIFDRCPREVAAASSGARKDDFVYWGDRWRCIEKTRFGEGEGIALIELPERFRREGERYGLHPAALDVATSFAAQVLAKSRMLPFSYGRLRMHQTMPARLYSHARLREDLGSDANGAVVFDVTLIDEQGSTIAEIHEFTLKQIASAGVSRSAAEPDSAPSGAIAPAQGVEAFARILNGCRAPQIVVSTRNVSASIAASIRPEEPAASAPGRNGGTAAPRYQRPALGNSYQAPRNDLEDRLASIWQEVLAIERIGIHDNFYELGGDSMISIRIIDRAAKNGIRLAAADVLEYPTLAELAASTERRMASQAASSAREGVEEPTASSRASDFDWSEDDEREILKALGKGD